MKRAVYILFVAVLALFSCSNKEQKKKVLDTPTSGVIIMSADESFAPIIEEEIDLFEFTYPKASIIPIYTSEVEVMDLLLTDSVRFAITTRDFSIEEKNLIRSKKMIPVSFCIAKDAIALIINKNNPDSMLTVKQVKDILTGKITSWKEINPKSRLKELSLTFDNKNSSTVRYALDSICKGEPLASKNIYAQGTNEKVIDYVAATPGAIGVIGASWIGNEKDSTNMSFSDKVRVVAMSRDGVATPINSYQPYQAYIALDYYPFTRHVYALNTSSRTGLVRGFSNFLASDKGQLIILKAGMMPTTQQVVIKPVKISD
ncbi:MAG: substrate-binding domain-containing protein [Bacteroidales bacterium]|nr:substrate-binding domain-containing protein [Bacteroidales bacterium]MBQ3575909.1 substrate-binding domain-containing protein [Coprobacter sp.]